MAATLAIVNTDICTMDPRRPRATAIAMTGRVIEAIGSDAEIQELCDARTEVVNGAGWVLTPGFNDGHMHLLFGGELGRGLDFDRVADLDAVRSKVSEALKDGKPDTWLTGYALEYSALNGHAYHHSMLDSITGAQPVLVWAFDLHTAFVNAAALHRAGITGSRDFLDGSRIVCDEDGKPTGKLQERSAVQLVLDVMPEPTPAERRNWYVDAVHRLNQAGFTSIHQMDGDPDTIATFQDLDENGDLTLHCAIHSSLAAESPAEYVDELLVKSPQRGRNWRADGVKFWLDGVIETGTAWLEHPDSEGDGTAPRWPSVEHYATLVRRCHAAGYRIATHAIGDRAVRAALDVYQALPSAGGQQHRIEHIETAPDSTMSRFRSEGVVASMQPVHLRWLKPDLSDPFSSRLDSDQCAHAMRSGDLAADGALVVLGSDWPVAPFDPRIGMYSAQLRRSPDASDPRPIGASKPLSGLEALAGFGVPPLRRTPGFMPRAVARDGSAVLLPRG